VALPPKWAIFMRCWYILFSPCVLCAQLTQYPGFNYLKFVRWKIQSMKFLMRFYSFPVGLMAFFYKYRQSLFSLFLTFLFTVSHLLSRLGTVGIVTGYRLGCRRVRVRVPIGARCFSSARPDRFWGPPTLLSNGYQGFFPRG
jgi:hypothetical protein